MSYSNSFPTQRPTLNLDFANSGKLDSRISYSRSSTGTALSSERHLSSENLIPYSNDLSQSVWTKRNLTIPATNITAPDETSTASSLLETTATSTHDFYEEFAAVSGASYTFTLYAKANGRDTFIVSPQATSTIASVVFDLTAVTSTVVSGSADSHSITAIGSTGWYKLQVTVTATGSGTGFLQTYFRVGGSTTYAGDATKGAYIWGCQVSSTGETVLNETSGQIHREYAPTLKTASANEPRFEYTADGESEGLLIEASATNLLPYGHNGYNSGGIFSMTLVDLSASQNAAVSPSGLLDATLLTDTGGLTQHRIDTAVSGLDTSKKYTLSGYFKATGTTTGFSLRIASGNTYGAEFNFSTGYVSAYGIAPDSYTFETVGNGWVRVSITAPLDLSTATLRINTGRGDVQSDDYSGMLFYGLQFEEGSAPSSVLLTSGSTVTRSADSCSVATADFGYTGGPMSIVIETPAGAGAGYIPYLFSLTGGDQNFYAFKNTTTASASDDWRYQVGGTGTTVSGSAGSDTVAIRWDTGDVKAQFSAGVSSTNSGAVETAFTGLKIGQSPANLYQLNGNLKRLSLYSVALSDTELAALVD